MPLWIAPNLLQFNQPIRTFTDSRAEHKQIELCAIIVWGDETCVMRRTHVETREESTGHSDKDVSLFDALLIGVGILSEKRLVITHVDAFLGPVVSHEGEALFFLVTVEGDQDFRKICTRIDCFEDEEFGGPIWIEKKRVNEHTENHFPISP